MKPSSKKVLTAVSILLLASCSGGGGDSGSSSSTLTEVDSETVNTLGANMATATPGCDYTSETVATMTYQPVNVASYRALVESLRLPVRAARNAARESDYSETLVGDCGGSAVVSGQHEDGDDDLTLSFNDYCTSDGEGSQAVASGEMSIFVDGTPSDSGPVLEGVGLSTGSSGVTLVSTFNGESSTNSLYLDDVELDVDSNDLGEFGLDADEIRVTDNGDDFRVTDLSMSVSDASGTSMMQIDSMTYHDPDSGAVGVTTSGIPLDSEVGGPVTITVTGADGSQATFTSTDVSSGVFAARDADGNVVGALDCSGLAAEF